jgi:hypothetical protein
MKRNTSNFSLNGIGTSITNKVGSTIWGNDALDKRNAGMREGLSGLVNTVSSVSDTMSNALGNRNPYYIIGEIPEEAEWGKTAEKYLGAVGGAVRAISKLVNGVVQEGVIIDCLGDVDGESSVEFTQNPIMYVTNNITDSRMRKPATVTAVVAVSNYNSDSIIEQAVNSLAGAADITGGWMTNVLTSNLFYGGNTRAQYALYRLRWLMENGSPFTVHTPHGIYENMLIKSIKPRTDDTKMDMLYATIEFEEIIMYATYKQTLDGQETPNMPARTAITEGSSAVSWIRGGLR